MGCISEKEREREKEEREANGQCEVAPVYRLWQAWREAPGCRGVGDVTVLMNVNRGDFHQWLVVSG